jgi:hypothetical protein
MLLRKQPRQREDIMQVAPTGEFQIGGGAGWVAEQVREGIADARVAMELTALDWNNDPYVGPHPREAALAAAREAAAHLTDALGVEAPQDAIDETRRALEEIGAAIYALERLGGRPPFVPITKPTGHFEGALAMLEQVETGLRHATVGFG